ncbi:MAG: DUF4870 domain-containing protein [Rhodoglobus sp.]
MTNPNPTNPQHAAGQPAARLTPAEDTQWASFAHLGGIVGFLPALIIWLVFKERGSVTNTEGKEALNFQITILLAQIVAFIISTIVVAASFGLLFFLPGLLFFAIVIVSLIFSVLGFTTAQNHRGYRYPFAIRFIK